MCPTNERVRRSVRPVRERATWAVNTTTDDVPPTRPGRRSALLADAGNLPNLLTLLRIAAVPLLVWLLANPTPPETIVAFVVFFVATMTDVLDGWLARRYGLITPLGKLLDPLADKLLVVSTLIMLAMSARTPGIPAWLLVIIIGREFAVTGLRSIAASEGIVLAAEASGKLKMVLQSVGIHALILHSPYWGISFYALGIGSLAVATVVGVWSAAQYHVILFRALARDPA
jgi:CDP-diacylglycerol--glycerol-3-phosphate 3-phosphatidyltransferase